MAKPAVKQVVRPAVVRYAESDLPTAHGMFRVVVYRFGPDDEEALAISMGRFPAAGPVFARVHSECFTGEVLGSLKCDCRDQLELALDEIRERGQGVLIYLRQEGRGIGLGNKIRAYALQATGADTVEANHKLGFPTDLREFDIAAAILHDLGVDAVELHTNNPSKVSSLRDQGIEVVRRIAAHGSVNPHNRDYLETKNRALGHDLSALLCSAEPAD
jgi:GTP cyclohydrolase II